MDDVAPELYENIRKTYVEKLKNDVRVKDIYRMVKDGSATHEETQQLCNIIADITSRSMIENIYPDTLPNGRFYYNIAQRTVVPILGEAHGLVMNTAAEIQKHLNSEAGIGLKAISPQLDSGVVNGLVNSLTNAEDYSQIVRVLGEPLRNTVEHFGNEFIKTNAEFQRNAGLMPMIERSTHGNACAWCQALDTGGLVPYDEKPDDIFRKHKYCRCTVIYYPSKNGKGVNVHTKQEVRTGGLYDKNIAGGYSDQATDALYETVRNLKGDIPIIAETAGISEYETREIKDYVFNNSEFRPYAPQAEAWLRIYDGVETEEDLIFITHEHLERQFRLEGMDYRRAHELANEDANWEKIVLGGDE